MSKKRKKYTGQHSSKRGKDLPYSLEGRSGIEEFSDQQFRKKYLGADRDITEQIPDHNEKKKPMFLKYILPLLLLTVIAAAAVSVAVGNIGGNAADQVISGDTVSSDTSELTAKSAEMIAAEKTDIEYQNLLADTVILDESGMYMEAIYRGSSVEILESENSLIHIRTEGGTEGYIDGRINSLGIDPTVDRLSIFDEYFEGLSINDKMDVLAEFFPDGKYWNHFNIDVSDMEQDESCMIVTDIPCEHAVNGYEWCNEYNGETLNYFNYDYNEQCLGFASMVSDFLFGKDAPISVFYDFDELRVGDHIRIVYYEHSMIVTEIGDGYVKVVECNSDYENCRINWGREVTEDELYYEYGNGMEYLTRYDDSAADSTD